MDEESFLLFQILVLNYVVEVKVANRAEKVNWFVMLVKEIWRCVNNILNELPPLKLIVNLQITVGRGGGYQDPKYFGNQRWIQK